MLLDQLPPAARSPYSRTVLKLSCVQELRIAQEKDSIQVLFRVCSDARFDVVPGFPCNRLIASHILSETNQILQLRKQHFDLAVLDFIRSSVW